MLSELQVDLANRITALAFLQADPPVVCLTEMVGDIENQIVNRLSAFGVAIVVLTPGGRWPNGEPDGLDLDVSIVIEVSEIPAVNQTGRRALQCVEEIVYRLHGAAHSVGRGAESTRRLVSEDPPFVLQHTPDSQDPLLTYQVFFRTRLALRAQVPAAPYVVGEDGITTTGEDGAQIAGDSAV